MAESFVSYRSFHEALKDLTIEQYGRVMYAINEYALNHVEVELTGIEKTCFTLIKPQLEANIKRQENGKYGSLGGRPKKEPQNTVVNNNNPMGFNNNITENPMGLTSEENKNPNVNLNYNENLNENGNIAFISPQSEVYANEVFNVLVDNDLPCCNKNIISFMQRDFRNAMETIHRTMHGIHSDEVIQAVKNYALVVNDPRTWHGWKAKKTFDRFVSWERFKDFLPGNFVLENFLEHSAPKQSNGIGKEDAFRIMEEMGVK